MMPSELPRHQHLRLVDLRKLAYEEANPAEAETLEAALTDCEACQARLDDLRSQSQAFLQSSRVEVESAQILARLEAAEARAPVAVWRRFVAPLGAALVAAAALFALVPAATGPSEPTTRLKGGGVGLVMFVKDARGIRRATDGEHLREGDQVQFKYAASGRAHLFVVSVDGRGVVSPLYPEDPTESIRVEGDGSHVLEGSVILDDAVGPERFFAIFSEAPVRFSEIDSAVRSAQGDVGDVTGLSSLPLGREDVAQVSVRIVKE